MTDSPSRSRLVGPAEWAFRAIRNRVSGKRVWQDSAASQLCCAGSFDYGAPPILPRRAPLSASPGLALALLVALLLKSRGASYFLAPLGC
jgi:hypothetical protein